MGCPVSAAEGFFLEVNYSLPDFPRELIERIHVRVVKALKANVRAGRYLRSGLTHYYVLRGQNADVLWRR